MATNMHTRILGVGPGPEEPWMRDSPMLTRPVDNAERAELVSGRAIWLAGLAYDQCDSLLEQSTWVFEQRDARQAVVAYAKEDARHGRP